MSIIFYGQETVAKIYYEAFEKAVKYLRKNLLDYDHGRYTLYIYDSNENMVKGLTKFSNMNIEYASFFINGACAAPINNKFHISHHSSFSTIAHEITHEYLKMYMGGGSLKLSWMNEGFAQYFDYNFCRDNNKYKNEYISMKQSIPRHFSLYKNNYIPLESISSGRQWVYEYDNGNRGLIYNETLITVLYLINKFGLKKIKGLYQDIQLSKNPPDEVFKKELGLTMNDIYNQVKKLNEKDVTKLL
ncbi:MAG: hypothetical protein JXB50_05585 [Spirochaetes bacterium]|nr:hypothetical protein [Spirochaetota bacterium]